MTELISSNRSYKAAVCEQHQIPNSKRVCGPNWPRTYPPTHLDQHPISPWKAAPRGHFAVPTRGTSPGCIIPPTGLPRPAQARVTQTLQPVTLRDTYPVVPIRIELNQHIREAYSRFQTPTWWKNDRHVLQKAPFLYPPIY